MFSVVDMILLHLVKFLSKNIIILKQTYVIELIK